MSMIFTTCIYHVCQLLYYSIVHTLYIHGTDVSVHVYARWSGFQMMESCLMERSGTIIHIILAIIRIICLG